MIRFLIHYGLHFLFPGLLAWLFYRQRWLKVWGILLLTMVVDLDHLIAVPVFAADRCSVGFHFLHSYSAIGVYVFCLLIPKLRIVAIGLLLHMATDYQDCWWM
jgi:hypothetical protein